MSTNCLSVRTCSRVIFFSSTRSLMKWCWMLIYLVLQCWIGFLEILMALKLSQNNMMTSCATLYYLNICFIHKSWMQQLPTIMYSTSTVERETQFSSLLKQYIKLFPRKKRPQKLFFSIPYISRLINITIYNYRKVGIKRVQNTIVRCSIYILNNSSYSSKMNYHRIGVYSKHTLL